MELLEVKHIGEKILPSPQGKNPTGDWKKGPEIKSKSWENNPE